MNTLREIGEFVGIPQGSLEAALFGGPPVISLRNVNTLVTIGKRKLSMRAVIQALQNLTPITLEAEIVGDRSGEEPFEVAVRLNASGGITWFTAISISSGGKVIGAFADVSTSGGGVAHAQLGRGEFQLVATRAGISNSGFVSLRVPLGTISVAPPPAPPPLPPPSPIPPTIAVETNPDGGFVVSGSGFSHAKPIAIRAQDQVNPQNQRNFVATASPTGALVDFQTGVICVVPGGQITFSAQDGTLDPSNNRPVISNF